jgi:fused signal recognition particle receptor
MRLADLFASTPALAAEHAKARPAPSRLERLRTALNRTRAFLGTAFATSVENLVDDDYFAHLEESLVLADVGAPLANELAARIAQAMRDRGLLKQSDALPVAREVLAAVLREAPMPPLQDSHEMLVLLLVGVNGSGKTTLAAKLAHRLRQAGHAPLLVAADTFRAAAAKQLHIWAERAGAQIVGGEQGADPASVVYDAVQAAMARHLEVVIVDTAGRLQTKHNLMQELAKISRAAAKGCPKASVVHLLVLDATVGQNALSQAVLFNECCPLMGIAVAKLDGTAKGGAIVAVARQLKIPVLFAGVGEQLDDLLDFDPEEFATALLPDRG